MLSFVLDAAQAAHAFGECLLRCFEPAPNGSADGLSVDFRKFLAYAAQRGDCSNRACRYQIRNTRAAQSHGGFAERADLNVHGTDIECFESSFKICLQFSSLGRCPRLT